MQELRDMVATRVNCVCILLVNTAKYLVLVGYNCKE